jgi:branched-subunit amino acid aminotransferase/4-amino-4-deoxychorismate lyase
VLWLYGDSHLITEAGTMNIFFVFKNDKNGIINNKRLLLLKIIFYFLKKRLS